MTSFSFTIENTCQDARAGILQTPNGTINTPIFMPVGTQGSVKALCPVDLKDAGAQIILGNTYHLMLRPGKDFFLKHGPLRKYMSWNGPILTDSGGFQVFSLGQNAKNQVPLVKILDDKVIFKSYLDGSIHHMPPEESMNIQMAIGSDIIMALDVCPMAKAPREKIQRAMELTTNWLKRCQKAMTQDSSRLFGIVQGGIHEDLRLEHAQSVASLGLFGHAIGGLSVGENKEDMWKTAAFTAQALPQEKPRYLMGVGTPLDILEGIKCGIDMFDCVMPTRNARNGCLFTNQGKVSIKLKQYKEDFSPIDESCLCYTCQNFSRSYLRHLYMSKEVLYLRLASLHNIRHYLDLVRNARKAILNQSFQSFYEEKKQQLV